MKILLPKDGIYLLTALLFCWGINADLQAQSQEARNWAFPMGNGLKFNPGSIDTFSTSVGSGVPVLNRGTSTMSDGSGNLLMYSNGEQAWNMTHSIIMGGDSLLGSKQTTQSSLIIPWPEAADRYFLFTLDDLGGPDGLNYYLVDMTLNGGQGMVFPGPTQVLDTATEKLCATLHANDRDYWVVAHRWNSDEFHAFKVDPNGVNNTPVISAVGSVHTGTVNGTTGQMKISPDGTKIALANFTQGFVELFDFDPETGTVSNPLTLVTGATNLPHGIAFSNDSKKFYFARKFSGSPPAEIFQYDLEHASLDCLLDSKTSVGIPNPLKIMGDLQLAVNGKIYITFDYPVNYNDTLAVINKPNLKGLDCDFQEFGPVIPGSQLALGLTNFISTYQSDGIYYEFGTNCENDSTVLWPQDTAGVDSVQWNFGDPGSGANTSTQIPAKHVFSQPDTFLVTLYRYEGNSVDTLTRNVVVWDTASNLLGPDTTLCTGQSITFDASWYDACVQWSDSSTMSTLAVNTSGWHWVDVYHQSCTFRDSVFVTTVNGPPQFDLGSDTAVCAGVTFEIDPDLQNAFYTWQDGSHDTTLTVSSTGTYWLEASNACGTTSDTLNVTLDAAAQPVLSFPEDTTVCDTVPFVVDVTFEDAVYEWSDGDSDPVKAITTEGVYWVEVGNSCDTVSDTMTVNFHSPYVSALQERDVLCDPSDDTLAVAAVASQEDVLWSTGVLDSVLLVTDTGTYWFVAANNCGELSDTIHVALWDTSYRVHIGEDTTLCATGDTFLLAHRDERFPFSYNWSTGTSSASTLAFTPGVYTLTATNRCSTQVVSRTVTLANPLRIAPLPDSNICEGETRTLEVLAPFSALEWSTGDSTARITVAEAGTYVVLITDTSGCIHRDSVSFSSICEALVFAPNVFTPDRDGFNDEFCIEQENVRSLQLVIFNRWGLRVFETSEPGKCWDGDIHSAPANEGVYYYLFEGEGSNGESFSYRGSLTLLR